MLTYPHWWSEQKLAICELISVRASARRNGAELSALRTTEKLVHAIKEKLCDLAVMGSVMTNGVRSSAVRGTISTSRCRLSGTTWPGIKSELFRLAYAQFSRSGTAKPARKRR
jgi:hypothetical protein